MEGQVSFLEESVVTLMKGGRKWGVDGKKELLRHLRACWPGTCVQNKGVGLGVKRQHLYFDRLNFPLLS